MDSLFSFAKTIYYFSYEFKLGGHLTHGAKPAQSGKWFNALHYEVDKDTGLIDYKSVEKLAVENKPKLIIAGGGRRIQE